MGYREITLLGQNVDSYYWTPSEDDKNGWGKPVTFAALLEMVAQINPMLRIRFSTSHPKDITDDVLHTINKYENICKYIHLPVQSGSNRVLQLIKNQELYKRMVHGESEQDQGDHTWLRHQL